MLRYLIILKSRNKFEERKKLLQKNFVIAFIVLSSYIQPKPGYPKHFFKWLPLKKLKKLWPPSTRLLKKLPLKAPKTFFCYSCCVWPAEYLSWHPKGPLGLLWETLKYKFLRTKVYRFN